MMKHLFFIASVGLLVLTGCSNEPSAEKNGQTIITSVGLPSKPSQSFKSQNRNSPPAIDLSDGNFPVAEYANETTSPQSILYRGSVEFTNGTPVTEATVSLATLSESSPDGEGTHYAEVNVNSEGKFRLGIANGQNYEVTVTSPLATTGTEYLHTINAYPISRTSGFQKQIESRFQLKSISKQIINISDDKGTSVTHASVYAHFHSSVITAEQTTSGSYIIPVLENVPTPILIRAAGYEPRFLTPFNHHGQTTYSVVLNGGGGTVSGDVIDQERKPVTSGVLISMNLKLADIEEPYSDLFEKAFEAITNENGRYHLEGIPTGRKLTPTISLNSPICRPLTKSCSPDISFSLNRYEHREHNITGFSGLTVTGIVFDKETGAPLPNIRVVSNMTGAVESVTDAEGRYTFHTGSDLTLDVKDTKYVLPESEVRVYLPGGCVDFPAVIRRDIEVVRKVELSGTVYTLEGLPVPNANVTFIKGIYRLAAITDAQGKYVMSVNPMSKFELIAVAVGFAETASGTITVGVDDVSGADITLKLGNTISAKVTDIRGNPIHNARISFGGETYSKVVFTEADGTFQIPNFTEDQMLAADAPGYVGQMGQPLLPQLADGETSGGLIIKLSAVGKVRGRFISADGSLLNLAGRQVGIYGNFGDRVSATIDINNSFTFDGLEEDTTHTVHFTDIQEEGKYAVFGSKENILTYYHKIKPVVPEDSEEGKEPKTPVETNSVEVSVLSGNDNNAIPNAEIEILPRNTSTTITEVPSTGLFSLHNVAKQSLIKVSAEGYYDDEIRVKDSGSSEVQKFTIKLVPVSSLSGRLVDAENGNPVGNALVSIYNEEIELHGGRPPDLYALTDNDGKFLFGRVKHKKVFVSIDPKKTYGSFYNTVLLGTNGKTDMGIIRLEKSGSLKGNVLKKGKFPSKRTEVVLKRTGSIDMRYESSFKTDDYGRFSFENLTPGEYLVNLRGLGADGERTSATVKIESGIVAEIELESISE